ncbi:hypothetical protein RHMOL_Rhmol01G0360700 [Rhododendron molle]|uniref:Uncharacterized protein n=1 Tax=Rhododendron molle TaxID=49168 RepID=A0ACC0QBA4_RHOML|nr:hypothetical protein RHMOL_Rhmol01G0360700 [Rhododendron molle]
MEGGVVFSINVSSASPFTSPLTSSAGLFSPPPLCLISLWPPPSSPSNRSSYVTSFNIPKLRDRLDWLEAVCSRNPIQIQTRRLAINVPAIRGGRVAESEVKRLEN